MKQLKIVHHQKIAYKTYKIILQGSLVKKFHQAGQFLNIKLPNSSMLLMRPISLADIDKIHNTCTLIYTVVGNGTKLLSTLPTDHKLEILGPLGKGFNIDFIKERDTVLLIGGSVGVAPLYELAKQIIQNQASVIEIFGYRTAKNIFYTKEFEQLNILDINQKSKLFISTDNGSSGKKGTVDNLIDDILPQIEPSAIYACGSRPMLKHIQKRFANYENAYISVDARMACGIGACYGCVLPTYDTIWNKKVCTDGPVFKTNEILL